MHGCEIVLGDRACVADGKVISSYFVKRSPKVDDGPASRFKPVCFLLGQAF